MCLLFACKKEAAISNNELYSGNWSGSDNTHEYSLFIPSDIKGEGKWSKSKIGSSVSSNSTGVVRVNDKKLFIGLKGLSIDENINLDEEWWKMKLSGVEYRRDAGNEINGEYTFWIASDLGGGPITVYLNNVYAGVINNFFPNGVSCGNGDVNISKPAGVYTFFAQSQGGQTWTEEIEFVKSQCSSYELTN